MESSVELGQVPVARGREADRAHHMGLIGYKVVLEQRAQPEEISERGIQT